MTIEKGFDDSLKIGERKKIVKNFDNEKVLKLIRIKNNRCPERGGERESILQYRRKFIYYEQLNVGFITVEINFD